MIDEEDNAFEELMHSISQMDNRNVVHLQTEDQQQEIHYRHLRKTLLGLAESDRLKNSERLAIGFAIGYIIRLQKQIDELVFRQPAKVGTIE